MAKFWGTALLIAVVAFLAGRYWSPVPAPAPPSPPVSAGGTVQARTSSAEMESLMVSLERINQRLEALESRPAVSAPTKTDLEARVAALEAGQARDTARLEDFELETRATADTWEGYTESTDPFTKIRESFDNDNNADVDTRLYREDAAALFDRDVVNRLEFSAMDCRKTYCRLQYNDYSEDGGEAALQENELLLLLSERYGTDIIVHGGEREGSARSFYIEFPRE